MRKKQNKIILPYINGTTDKISNVLKKHSIKTTSEPLKTIRPIIPKAKDKMKLENKGVYEIP